MDIPAIAPGNLVDERASPRTFDIIVASARVELGEVAAITELSDGRNVFLQLKASRRQRF